MKRIAGKLFCLELVQISSGSTGSRRILIQPGWTGETTPSDPFGFQVFFDRQKTIGVIRFGLNLSFDLLQMKRRLIFSLLSDQDGWHDVELMLPVKGKAGIVRIFLTASDTSPVDIESIEFSGAGKETKTWNFKNVNPDTQP